MRAKLIYEKFEQDTDPIKDLNIGAINLYKKALELTHTNKKSPRPLGAKVEPWNKYYGNELPGKTIYGKFKRGHHGEISRNIITKRFKILRCESYFAKKRFIYLIDEDERSYYVLENEYYIIS